MNVSFNWAVIVILQMLVTIAFVGAILQDWKVRAELLRELKESSKAYGDALLNIQKVHNQLVNDMQMLQDKVNAHEFRLTAAKQSLSRKG